MFFALFLVSVLNLGLSTNDSAPSLNLKNNLFLDSTKPEAQQALETIATHAATPTSAISSLYLTASSTTPPFTTTAITSDRTSLTASLTTTDIALSTQRNLPILSQHSRSTLFPPTLKPKVLETAAYNQEWFTQGLYKDQEGFYISSGLYNKSILIYQTPNQILRYFLPPNYFAEGLTVVDDKLFLLTWREETLFIFDKTTLTLINKISYDGEGWGLTHNDKSFIMSNGSNTLQFRDKSSFEVQHTLTIENLNHINELEYIDGVIWANRWYDEKIYALDSHSGCILTSINLKDLRLASITHSQKNVTNGIAYDREENGLWVTGKYWSHRFLIAIPLLDKSHCGEF
jgi:glutamine cyclotransferase